MVDELDKRIIALLQKDIPIELKPFAKMADDIGTTEELFISRVKAMMEQGIIRRFGATLYHQEAGFRANAMVAWVVPDTKIKEAGRTMAGFREVTHCYQRMPQGDWRYNLYAMIHGHNREECEKIAGRMSRKIGIDQYLLLFSEKEFKKTSMEYF